jgi:hypothetical protein
MSCTNTETSDQKGCASRARGGNGIAMRSRVQRLMRRQLDRRSLVLGFGLVVVLGLSAQGAEAKTSGCLVINSAANTSYTSLQAGVNGAQARATLWIRGTCTGTTEITKDVTLNGQRPGGFTAPTLDGGGQGSVLTVDSGVTLTVNTLTITGGSGTPVAGVAGRILGGGINSSDASVTLNDVSVSGNIAGSEGGGIVQGGGSLTLNDSTISGNTTGTGSGGLLAVHVSVTLNGSSTISGNTTKGGDGGGISLNTGSLTLNDTSTISDNSAGGDGGGAFIYAGAVTLNDSSSIRHNTAGWSGGGIYNLGGDAVTLNDTSSISANTAGIDGGGIDNSQWAGPVTLTGSSSITGNIPNNCAPPGSIAGCTG